MKCLLIILSSVAFLPSYAQKTNLTHASIFADRPTKAEVFHAVSSNFILPDFKTSNFNRSTYQNNQSNKPVAKQWQPLEYDPFRSFQGLDGKSAMVTVSSLQGHLGNIKISCDYMYDETGRLVDAVSSWNFGR